MVVRGGDSGKEQRQEKEENLFKVIKIERELNANVVGINNNKRVL